MKSMFSALALVLFVLLALTVPAMAADTAATAPAATVSTFQSIINWMTTNQVLVGALIVAVLDFIFAINPNWKANGILHFIYDAANAKKSTGTTPPSA